MIKNKTIKIIFWVLLILFILYFVYFTYFQKIMKRRKTLEMQLDMINQEVSYMEKENANLKAGISDSLKEEYLEKEARLNLGYKKEGETAVILSGTTTTKNENQKVNLN